VPGLVKASDWQDLGAAERCVPSYPRPFTHIEVIPNGARPAHGGLSSPQPSLPLPVDTGGRDHPDGARSDVRSARPSSEPTLEAGPFRSPTDRALSDLAERLRTYPLRSSTESELTLSAPGQPGAILSFRPSADRVQNVGRIAPRMVGPFTPPNAPSHA
jgi:hypothetical protein